MSFMKTLTSSLGSSVNQTAPSIVKSIVSGEIITADQQRGIAKSVLMGTVTSVLNRNGGSGTTMRSRPVSDSPCFPSTRSYGRKYGSSNDPCGSSSSDIRESLIDESGSSSIPGLKSIGDLLGNLPNAITPIEKCWCKGGHMDPFDQSEEACLEGGGEWICEIIEAGESPLGLTGGSSSASSFGSLGSLGSMGAMTTPPSLFKNVSSGKSPINSLLGVVGGNDDFTSSLNNIQNGGLVKKEWCEGGTMDPMSPSKEACLDGGGTWVSETVDSSEVTGFSALTGGSDVGSLLSSGESFITSGDGSFITSGDGSFITSGDGSFITSGGDSTNDGAASGGSTSGLGDVLGGIGDTVGDVVGGAGDVLGDVTDGIGDVLGGISDAIGDVVGGDGDETGGIGDATNIVSGDGSIITDSDGNAITSGGIGDATNIVLGDGSIITDSDGNAITSGGSIGDATNIVLGDGSIITDSDGNAITSGGIGDATNIVSGDGSIITDSDGNAITSGGSIGDALGSITAAANKASEETGSLPKLDASNFLQNVKNAIMV
jgi:hypothetical protein